MKRILVPGVVSRRPVISFCSSRIPLDPFSLLSPNTPRTFLQYSSSCRISNKSSINISRVNTGTRITMSVVLSSPPPTSVVFMSTSTNSTNNNNNNNDSNNNNDDHQDERNPYDSSSSYENNATLILPLQLAEEDKGKQEEMMLEIVKTFCPFLWNVKQDEQQEEEQSSLVMLSSCSSCSSSSSSLTEEEQDNHERNPDAFPSPDKPQTTTLMMKKQKNHHHPYPPKHDSSHLTIQPLGGGLSNLLFVVSNIHDARQSVLVRIHPDDNDSNTTSTTTLDNSSSHELIDRHVENQVVAWLSSQGKAPLYYGRFTNGRVEEFYHGYQPMTCHDMVQYTSSIATHMAQYHQLQVPPTLFQNENGCNTTITSTESHGQIWDRIGTWFQMIGNTTTTTNSENVLLEDVPTLQQEFNWLQQELTTNKKDNTNDNDDDCHDTNTMMKKYAIDFCREIVFTHGDFQSLNILKQEQAEKNDENAIKIIDFEYAGMNPRGVDIANTFCEYCDMNNLRADYENEYPRKEIQNLFLRHYIQETLKNKKEEEATTCSSWLQTVFCENNTTQTQQEQEELFLTALRQEIGKYSLVSHLGWTLWSLVQNQISTIDFDYLAYGKHRMEGYRYFKPMFFQEGEQELEE